jgi:preprotein translocase subunit SecF
MGFSVHDTIVVFDRVRENMIHSPISTAVEFEKVANDSLVQTLNRSLNTSLTVILVLTAMAVLGGETIRPFIIALLVGISVGTYSSIFTAVPLLVLWQARVLRA